MLRTTAFPIVTTFFLLSCLPGLAAADDKPAKDILHGAVDPFEEGPQRAKFLKAAGTDNELDEQELIEDQKRNGSFVRSFDSWTLVSKFDKNRNSAIDWFEANAYRRTFRASVIEWFDEDRSGRLAGDEREVAVQAIEKGWVPKFNFIPAEARASQRPLANGVEVHPGLLPGIDTNDDGKISDEERSAFEVRERLDWQQQLEENRRNVLKDFDRDRNGSLDDAERKGFLDSLEHLFQESFDQDNDGQLNERELQKWRESDDARFLRLREKHDLDRDGLLSYKENETFYRELTATGNRDAGAAHKEVREVAAERFEKLFQEYDTDGDGKLTGKERERFDEAVERTNRGTEDFPKK